MDGRENIRVRVLCGCIVPVRSILPLLRFVIVVVVRSDPSAREAEVHAGDEEDEERKKAMRNEE